MIYRSLILTVLVPGRSLGVGRSLSLLVMFEVLIMCVCFLTLNKNWFELTHHPPKPKPTTPQNIQTLIHACYIGFSPLQCFSSMSFQEPPAIRSPGMPSSAKWIPGPDSQRFCFRRPPGETRTLLFCFPDSYVQWSVSMHSFPFSPVNEVSSGCLSFI